jgi:predicted lipoprotein with Yx(FWY)xxD motif
MGTKAMETTRTRGVTGKVAALAAVAATGLLVAACGSSGSSSTSSAAAPTTAAPASAPASTSASAPASTTATLKTEHTSLGTVLANTQGMTVYWFAADHGTTSACSGACAAAWPPVLGAPQAMAGVTLTGALGTITRSDGTKQATWDGHPLYTFSGDTAAGQVSGNKVNGFGALWYAVTLSSSTSAGAGGGASTAPSSTAKAGGGWS